MSLYGALFSGVSGLTSQSNKIAVISDNISNVNTVGYKGNLAQFQSLVTASGTGAFSPGGVIGLTAQQITKQGLLQSTSSPTDIAISGSGLFVVNQTADGTGQVLYTRAGSFTQDSTGNFRNSAGFFLQAWPLDRNGLLPGETGNENTTSSSNLSSLRTVNVQNLTGSASGTTGISLGANLNASQAAFIGAAGTITMDPNHSINDGIKATDLIIPGGANGLVIGDTLTVAPSSASSQTYTYGGFTYGRDVTDGTSSGDGANGLDLKTDSFIFNQSTTALPNNPVTTGAIGTGTVTITTTAAHNLAVGDAVTLAGLAATDGITAPQLNTTHIITAVTATSFTVVTTGSSTAGTTAGGGAAGTFLGQEFATTSGSKVVTVRQPAHGLVTGDVVTFNSISAAVNGIPSTELNDSFVITRIDADHYTITVPTTPATATGGGGAGTVVDMRPFAGNILDATTATQTFLGTTGTSDFTSAALSFTITSPSTGTNTFTYSASTPNVQLGQFNNLTNLAAAISSVTGLTARVGDDDRLYIGSIDATEQLTFANGSAVGTSGPPVQAGIDWIRELGVDDVAAASNTFSTMQGLADLVNATDGLSATVSNPLGTASVDITVDDPLGTITFTDPGVGTHGLLAELGLTASGTHTTGALGPSYDPGDSTKNMASGSITPQFSRPIQVFDGLGGAHTLNASFLKTGVNTWAVELYTIPSTDVSNTDGLVASGTITFNGDGSLRSVDTSLTDPFTVNWTGGSDPTQITVDWGTAGAPGVGKTDGLGQFSAPYRVNFVNQNGTPVGDLTSVSIDDEGFVVANYSNGDNQRLYKIPLADFANPDALQSLSGNVFLQTSESGEVNLTQPGTSGVGKIASSSLEASNVELADQLTAMIVAQRAYQANTKVISTADSLLDDLNRILQ